MSRTKCTERSTGCGGWPVAALVAGFLVLGGMVAAQQPSSATAVAASRIAAPLPDLPAKRQQTFASAQSAVDALVAALKTDNRTALDRMLGPDAEKLLSSGDATEDTRDRQQFLEKYAQMHRMVSEGNGLTTLFVGAENWPAPIPIAHRGYLWYFDTPAGEKEVLYRRIGENELTAIQVCQELVQAERDYHAQPRGGAGERQYAQRMLSSPGKQDGLYWQTAPDRAASPLGPMLASAEADGYPQGASPHRTPFYGYYFRILKAQGPDAAGGAKSYLSDGKMTGGFAFVGFPAEYRSSGVMTFLVGPDGVVYQKDLGPKTAQLAKSMKSYDPDGTWAKAK
ncbi:MAG: DUF2950 domain-containing protein [Acidobacteriota bacterium]